MDIARSLQNVAGLLLTKGFDQFEGPPDATTSRKAPHARVRGERDDAERQVAAHQRLDCLEIMPPRWSRAASFTSRT